jgi:hypothetical protein
MKHFGSKAVGIMGDVSDKDRLKAVDRFMEDPTAEVFIGNTRAAGEGITLTSSCYLAFNDVTQIPTDQLQGEDRIHRGGAKNNCSIYFFIADVDEDEDAFDNFINDKAVVNAVTNRRDKDGEIKDAKWVGEDAAALNENLVNKAKTDFDWEDAGEEPPANYVDPSEAWRARATAQRMAGRSRPEQGLLLNESTDNLIARQMNHILPKLRGGDRAFMTNIGAWYVEKGFLTPKQKARVQDVIAAHYNLLSDFEGGT